MELKARYIEKDSREFERLVTEGYFSGTDTDDDTAIDTDELSSGSTSNMMFIQRLSPMISAKHLNILNNARMIEALL